MKSRSNPPQTPNNLAKIPTYRAGILQSATHRQLKKFTEECLRQHELSMMQWFMVGSIYDAGPDGISTTQLSNILGTNVPYVTNMLNRLVAKGIVSRNGGTTKDGRYKAVTLRPDYLETVVSIESDLRAKMRGTIYEAISPEELRIYIGVLMKISNALAK